MIDPMKSYENVELIEGRMQKDGYQSDASHVSRPSSSRYPPYRTDTLVIKNYKHLGLPGQLTLEFFNDRLYEAHFKPDDPPKYLALLRKKGLPLKREQIGKSEFTVGNLRVATNIDFATSDVGKSLRTEPYVIWQDLRLVAQLRDWGPIR
jgi:hypothetical protein